MDLQDEKVWEVMLVFLAIYDIMHKFSSTIPSLITWIQVRETLYNDRNKFSQVGVENVVFDIRVELYWRE